MRQALDGVLAPAVQWRPGKTDFSDKVVHSLRVVEAQHVSALLDLWESSSAAISGYLDLSEVSALWQNVQSAPESATGNMRKTALLWKTLSLGLWLNEQK